MKAEKILSDAREHLFIECKIARQKYEELKSSAADWLKKAETAEADIASIDAIIGPAPAKKVVPYVEPPPRQASWTHNDI